MRNKLNHCTSIKVPEVYHEVLPRLGIEKIINNSSINEAVCIVAPYGCGKTLSVISWLNGRNVAWIELNEHNNNEEDLLKHCWEALLSFSDTIENSFINSDEYKDDPWGFLIMQASMLEQGSERIIVFDNFRFIKEIGLIRKIKDFIYACLGRISVIIISRVELHPVFNDLMLKRYICLITIKDLSFNADEISAYFSMNGCEVSQEEVLRLREDTEGWPAALNVVLTITRGGEVSYSESSREYVRSFFETEIWNDLDENIKNFLLKTSVLKMLSPASCHAVTGIGASLPILNWLYLNGMFISKLEERDTYKYHSVFMDFLENMRKSVGIDEKALYRKAAWWFYEKNDFEQSFPYFFYAGDLYGLSRVLRIINPSIMSMEDFLDMTLCITELNIEDLKQYPVILARMALIQYLTGNIEKMQELFKTYLKWNDTDVLLISPEEYAEYLWEAGWLYYLNPDEEVRNNQKHEEWTNYKDYVPHLQNLHRGRAAVIRFPSILRGIRDYSTVLDLIEPYLKNAEKEGSATVTEAVSIWEMYLILAEYSYETEDYIKAEELIRRIMALVENEQMTDLYFVCTVLMVKLLRAKNTVNEISLLTERLEIMIMNTKQYFMLPNFHAFQLRNSLVEGNIGLSEAFTDENSRYIEKPYYYLLYRHVTLTRALISQSGFNEALLILENLEIMCHKYKRTMDLIELAILKSIALYAAGNEENAVQHLSDALKTAKLYGYIRIFSDDAKGLWPVLEIVKKQITDSFTKNVILSCKKTLIHNGYKFPGKKGKHSELTKTELKILKSLQISMSYEEIALDNNIRISTVKSHVHSIYSKLNADNKTSAVITAQDLGIIPPINNS